MLTGAESLLVHFKSLYHGLLRENHQIKPVFYHFIAVFLDGFSPSTRPEGNSPLYHLVSGYLNNKILFLYKCKTSKTPFGRDLILHFGKIGGVEINIA